MILNLFKVPDRGGRTDEIRAPLPEMPSWQKRTADRGGGRGNFNMNEFSFSTIFHTLFSLLRRSW